MTDEERSEYGAQYNDVDTTHSKMAFKTVQKASEFINVFYGEQGEKDLKRNKQTLTDVEEE